VPLASLEDINLHLPEDKTAVDTSEYEEYQLDAERIVRGTLAGVIDRTVLASWLTPDDTPGLIRGIVGRLVAAFTYRKQYSEDSLEDPEFAQNKYNEAMAYLEAIVDGKMVLEEVETVGVASGHVASTDYFPNNRTEGPFFRRGMEL
jgi:hypothetical protein